MKQCDINRLQSCIDDKIIEHVLDTGRSVSDTYLIYHHHITEISTLFYNPNEHYSKIMVMAMHKTIRGYEHG